MESKTCGSWIAYQFGTHDCGRICTACGRLAAARQHVCNVTDRDGIFVHLDLCKAAGTIKKTAQLIDLNLYFTSGGDRGGACIARPSGKRD